MNLLGLCKSAISKIRTPPITLPASLFPQPESDRAAVEVREKKCLYSTYYANFKDFKQAISECLAQTHTTYKKELDSLLLLRFQTFAKLQIMAL
jgi:hypothetical protein